MIVNTVLSNPCLQVERWKAYIRAITKYHIADWFEQSPYHNSAERGVTVEVEDVDAFLDQQQFAHHRHSDVSYVSVLVPELIAEAVQQCLKLLQVVRCGRIKRNLIFNLAAKSLTEDITDYLRRLQPATRARINLLRHCLQELIEIARYDITRCH